MNILSYEVSTQRGQGHLQPTQPTVVWNLNAERFRRAYLHLSHITASRNLAYMIRLLSTFVAHQEFWGPRKPPQCATTELSH
jgi:hypothetical protein